MEAIFFLCRTKSETDKRFPKKPAAPTVGERCVLLCLFNMVTDSAGLSAVVGWRCEGGGSTSCYSSFHTNRTWYMSWQSHWARRSVFVCVCVQLCRRICVGLCQEMAELSGMRCLLHSLAVGVSIMRVTEGCLCVGECFSAFCVMYMYSMCVWVLEMLSNNIFNLPVFPGYKRQATHVKAPMSHTFLWTYAWAPHKHTQGAWTIAGMVTVYLIN